MEGRVFVSPFGVIFNGVICIHIGVVFSESPDKTQGQLFGYGQSQGEAIGLVSGV